MNMIGANSTIGISKITFQYKVSGWYCASDADVLTDNLNDQNFIEADCYG